MAIRCRNGHDIADEGNFCPVCGVQLRELTESEIDAPPVAARSASRQEATGGQGVLRRFGSIWSSLGWKAKTASIVIAALLGLAVLGAAIGDSGSTDSEPSAAADPTTPVTEKPKPRKPKGYVELLLPAMTPQKAARPLCTRYRATLSDWTSLASQRLASSQGATRDSYAAAAFDGRVSWIDQDHEGALDRAVYRASRTRLRAVSRNGLTVSMIERFQKDALWICKLSGRHRDASSRLRQLDQRLLDITNLARSVPWYPREFTEWDDNIAWQWVDDPSCDYFSCSQMIVIARDGCPSGLYAEVNFKSGGTVVGYSNDALGSLGAGENAILTFTDTSDYGSVTTWLTEINCY